MERFVTRHGDRIDGILTGFDRMRFRGTLRSISFGDGLQKWLNSRRVLLKDFGAFAERLSTAMTVHAKTMAAQTGRPLEYLSSWKIRKEDRAREIAARDGIEEGLIAIFSSRGASRLRSVATAPRSACAWSPPSGAARICIFTIGIATSD